METNDLGDKKFNNEQSVNEGFSGENISKNYNPAQMKTEYETDVHGNQVRVERANIEDSDLSRSENESKSSIGEEEQKKVEHKDRNSDLAANRYPNSHPDNHHNRGNLELDE
jgi:hypothetical protein